MQKIEIKITDGLTPAQEAAAIAKKLLQKKLTGTSANKDQILIGQGMEISHIQTQITVTRVSKEKPVEMVTCNVCGCEYQNNTALFYWHNYGGKPTKRPVCSVDCQEAILSFLSVRGAKTRNKLQQVTYLR